MLIEGKGMVVPTPAIIQFTSTDVEFVRSAAEERNRTRRYSSRADQWGRGIVADPVMCGLLGEHGLCLFINRRTGQRLQIDRTPRKYGDGGRDVEVAGLIIEVKTRVTGRKFLVRRVDDRKRIRELVADLVVFANLTSERELHLMGWMSRSEVRSQRHVPSHVGDWWNLEINEHELSHMNRLIEEIELRRAA